MLNFKNYKKIKNITYLTSKTIFDSFIYIFNFKYYSI